MFAKNQFIKITKYVKNDVCIYFVNLNESGNFLSVLTWLENYLLINFVIFSNTRTYIHACMHTYIHITPMERFKVEWNADTGQEPAMLNHSQII